MKAWRGRDLWRKAWTGAVALALWIGAVALAGAAPVTAGQAEGAVRAWLARTPAPLGERVGAASGGTQTYRDARGSINFYTVNLNPDGFVIVAGDDLVEPIVGFFPKGRFDPADTNPLGFLAGRDLAQRMAEARGLAAAGKTGKTYAPQGAQAAAQRKWAQLLYQSKPLGDLNEGLVNDLRVAPLVGSRWGQTAAGGVALYNYYTPPLDTGDALNYPTGCLATALAQLMRFHQWPLSGVGTASYQITVDTVSQWRALRGGNGAGGPYDWAAMALDPSQGIMDAQRQAIGALTGDAAVAMETDFAGGGSGANLQVVKTRIHDVFQYANAVYSSNYSGGNWLNLGAALPAMVNPNLDAGLPVILSIFSTTSLSAHAAVCDGYGYNGGTIYHHCNLGWSGSYNGWYNLPQIGTPYNYDMVLECLYNIYVSGTGELVSGRVTDGDGRPLAGAVVTATRGGGGPFNTQTNANGIYALKYLPSDTQFTVTAAANTYIFAAPRTAATGRSEGPFPNAQSGNVWGADFQAQPDAWPRVQLTSATTSRREDAGVVTLIVQRNAAPAYASTVDVTVSGGTAAAGADFTLSTTTVAIQAGQTTASFGVALVNDAIGEAVETVVLTIVPHTACLPGKQLTHTLTIVDDDNYLAEALDNYQIFWRTRGDGAWQPQTATSHDGADAGQSGAVGPGQTSTLYAYVNGPGTLGFWWAVAAPAGDTLTFNDNGTTAALNGTSGFQNYGATLGAGTHLLQWTLRRAANSPAGPATGWLDQVSWTGGVPSATTPTPYYGAPTAIPGPIEAEDFDAGGNATAYYDSTPGNAGGAYRPGEDVDIYPCADLDGGWQVGNIAPDEWLGYTVAVSEAGLYTLRLRVASAAAGRCRLTLGGSDLAGEITVPATGQAWQTVEIGGVALAAGGGVLRLETATGGFNINRIEFLPEMGALTVTIEPAEAVATGAMWRRVGTPFWRASGSSDPAAPAGTCIVEFQDAAGWRKPDPQNIWIDKDAETALTGHYSRQIGFLYVAIDPPQAGADGAAWRRAGTATWIGSGATEGVFTGQYTLEFKAISGWRRPPGGMVNILDGQTVTTTGVYGPAGSLNVNILPGIAAGAGAKWRRTGTAPWLPSGAIEEEVPAGQQYVEFQAPAGWSAPLAALRVLMFQGQFVQTSATFTRQTGCLRVNLLPPAAAAAGARWRRAGETAWRLSGEVESNIPTGVYIVDYLWAAGWLTPALGSAQVDYNTTVTVNGLYTSKNPSAVPGRAWMKY